MLRKGELTQGPREEFMDEMAAILDQAADTCFICDAADERDDERPTAIDEPAKLGARERRRVAAQLGHRIRRIRQSAAAKRKPGEPEYVDRVPKEVPTGKVLVHNHVRPRKTLGLGGFRAWLAKPEAIYEECPCDWAPQVGTHYRVRRAWFHVSVQNFLANAFSVGIVRNMVPRGTLANVQEFLKEIDLEALSKKSASQFPQELDRLTEELQQRLPKGHRHWGVARQCLNLFFRYTFYNHYLRKSYDLDKLERYLEIPLNSHVGTELRRTPEGKSVSLPRWRTLKRLEPGDSKRFQDVAKEVAKRGGTERVHLDVVFGA
jgi:hypothetical protein